MTPPDTMKAMVTMGHGDLDQMVLHTDWPRPKPAADEVLIKVGACGLNNTDVNTRSGWYSKTVTDATTGGAFAEVGEDDPTWGGTPITFPRIQGEDVCGEIVTVGADVDPSRIGELVITDGWLRDADELDNINKSGHFGSERAMKLDECVTGISVAQRIVAERGAEICCLKLSNLGGLAKARRVRDYLADNRIPVVAEDTLGGVWACQDMLTIDIACGRGSRNKDGHLHLPEEPGLGVHPDEHALGEPVAVYA